VNERFKECGLKIDHGGLVLSRLLLEL